MGLLGLRPLTKGEDPMSYAEMEMQTEAKPSLTLESLKRLAHVIESLEQRAENLTRRLEIVLESDHPRANGVGVDAVPDDPGSSPLVNEMRHHTARLQRLEAHLANLTGRLTV